MVFKGCIICPNNSNNCPEKYFLSLPRNRERRAKWFEVVNKPYDTNRFLYCCEDHFNLEEDAENWQYFKMMGSRIFLKPNVLPRINVTRPEIQSGSQQSSSSKRRKKELLQKIERTKEGKEMIDTTKKWKNLFPKQTGILQLSAPDKQFVVLRPQQDSTSMASVDCMFYAEHILEVNLIEIIDEEHVTECRLHDSLKTPSFIKQESTSNETHPSIKQECTVYTDSHDENVNNETDVSIKQECTDIQNENTFNSQFPNYCHRTENNEKEFKEEEALLEEENTDMSTLGNFVVCYIKEGSHEIL